MNQPFILFLLTDIASTKGFIVACIIVFICFILRRKRESAFLFFISTFGLMVSTTLLKELFETTRSLDALIEVTGYAFPSGHASGAMFLGLVVAYLSRNLVTPLRNSIFLMLAVLVLTIGISRIMYLVHTPLQVVAGFALGIFWALLFIRLSKRNQKILRTD